MARQEFRRASDARQKFEQFIAAQARDTGRQETQTPQQDDAFYQQFLQWRKSTDAKQ